MVKATISLAPAQSWQGTAEDALQYEDIVYIEVLARTIDPYQDLK